MRLLLYVPTSIVDSLPTYTHMHTLERALVSRVIRENNVNIMSIHHSIFKLLARGMFVCCVCIAKYTKSKNRFHEGYLMLGVFSNPERVVFSYFVVYYRCTHTHTSNLSTLNLSPVVSPARISHHKSYSNFIFATTNWKKYIFPRIYS